MRSSYMKYLFIFALSCLVSTLHAQSLNAETESGLLSLYEDIFAQKSDADKEKASAKFKETLRPLLLKQGMMDYPFDSLNLCKLVSPDERFRIFNWNIPLKGGKELYEGLIAIPDEKTGMVKVIELKDRSADLARPEDKVTRADNWFGALYYKIIPFKRSGGDHYVILGWDGDSRISNRKVIDVITLRGGDVRFGAPVFKTEKGMKKRVLFTFSQEVSMSLVYDEKKERIIFDHLAPKESRLEGQYQFYGPDMSFDALELSKGKWIWISDVVFKRKRNEKDKNFNDPRIR